MAKKGELIEAARAEFAGILPAVERWHAMAERHSRIAIWCAACCGHELLIRKKEIGHGGWLKFIKALSFSDETARKYMDLAVEWTERVGQIPTAVGISESDRPKLLEGGTRSTLELTEDQFCEISEGIHQAVGEKTLRQLYFEWGICKEPYRAGGRMGAGGTRATPTAEEIRETYAAEWKRIVQDLTQQGRTDKTYLHLTDSELAVHRDGIAYALAELDGEIARRAKKGGR